MTKRNKKNTIKITKAALLNWHAAYKATEAAKAAKAARLAPIRAAKKAEALAAANAKAAKAAAPVIDTRYAGIPAFI